MVNVLLLIYFELRLSKTYTDKNFMEIYHNVFEDDDDDKDQLQIVHLLIQYGADVNAIDGFNECALHFCSRHHYFKHALLLLLVSLSFF